MAFLGGSGSGMMKSYESNRSLLKGRKSLSDLRKETSIKIKKGQEKLYKKANPDELKVLEEELKTSNFRSALLQILLILILTGVLIYVIWFLLNG